MKGNLKSYFTTNSNTLPYLLLFHSSLLTSSFSSFSLLDSELSSILTSTNPKGVLLAHNPQGIGINE